MHVQVYRRHETLAPRNTGQSHGTSEHLEETHTGLRWMRVYLTITNGLAQRSDPPTKMTIYPSKYDQGPLLCKSHYEFFLIDRTCITRRMLLRDQQGRDYVAPALIFSQE